MTTTKITYNNEVFFAGIDHEAWTNTVALGDHERAGPPPAGYFLLRTTHTSPFARKVRIVADLLGVAEKIIMTPANFAPEGTQLILSNPIGRAPVIETSDGECLFESNLIIHSLCTQFPQHSETILPSNPNDQIENKKLEAVADTVTSSALSMVMEKVMHKGEAVSDTWIQRHTGKVKRCLDFLSENIEGRTFTHSSCIALACALGYLDWRGPEWRSDFPQLENWLHSFSEAVPSYLTTQAD